MLRREANSTVNGFDRVENDRADTQRADHLIRLGGSLSRADSRHRGGSRPVSAGKRRRRVVAHSSESSIE